MSSFRFLWAGVCLSLVSFTLSFGIESDENSEQETEKSFLQQTKVTGVSSVGYGQIIKGGREGDVTSETGSSRTEFNRDVLLQWEFWIKMDVELLPKIHGILEGGGQINYDLYAKYTANKGRRLLQAKGSFFGITQTYLDMNLIEQTNFAFGLKTGYFPFSYNPDEKNFGEYMYRTEAYPNILTFPGGISNSNPKILGIDFTTKHFQLLQNDFLVTIETERYPYFDVSVTDFLQLNFKDIFTIGGGASLWRYIPVDKSATTPGLDEDLRESNNTLEQQKRLFAIDSSGGAYDTTFYSAKAIKLVGQVSFDPKKLLPFEIFGEEDLKLYAEAALLGFKNYPVYYEKREERMPVMVGFNIPTFKILDRLTIELELHKWKYANSLRSLYVDSYVTPEKVVINPLYPDLSEEQLHIVEVEDNFKWCVYFSRTFQDHFCIQGQFAKDHLRLPDYEGVPAYRTNFEAWGDWYYLLGFQYLF